jgi:hypothetical protein
MTWPMTMADLVKLTLMVVSVAQGVVYVGLALLLVAFIWWVFRMHRHPEWLFYDAIRVVLLAAVLAGVIVAFIPFVRWIRQLTS